MSYNQLLKGRYSQDFHVYHITVCTQDKFPYFNDFVLSRLLISEMKRLEDNKYLVSLAFVIMPEHFHWLIQLAEHSSLSASLQQLKGRSARKINCQLNRRGPLWQKGYHDHAIRQDENLCAVARYVVSNPLKNGLVNSLAFYPHWDAIWV